jgi:hypothetical protein
MPTNATVFKATRGSCVYLLSFANDVSTTSRSLNGTLVSGRKYYFKINFCSSTEGCVPSKTYSFIAKAAPMLNSSS